MARNRQLDTASGPPHRTLSAPGGFLLNMLMFLALVGFIVAIAFQTLLAAFWHNPFLNGLIIFVLFTGILYLSTPWMRSILDSTGSRLDEAGGTGRYMVGLLGFLGLLGTFWGLLD